MFESEVKLCKLLCLRLLLGFFLRFCYSYCCVVSETGQQKHQPYRNKEISRSKALAIIENQVSFQNFIVYLALTLKLSKLDL